MYRDTLLLYLQPRRGGMFIERAQPIETSPVRAACPRASCTYSLGLESHNQHISTQILKKHFLRIGFQRLQKHPPGLMPPKTDRTCRRELRFPTFLCRGAHPLLGRRTREYSRNSRRLHGEFFRVRWYVGSWDSKFASPWKYKMIIYISRNISHKPHPFSEFPAGSVSNLVPPLTVVDVVF